MIQEKLTKLAETPPRSVSLLREYSERRLIELKNELDIGEGWTDLVSVAATPKGWFHKLIDRSPRLQRIFQEVSC